MLFYNYIIFIILQNFPDLLSAHFSKTAKHWDGFLSHCNGYVFLMNGGAVSWSSQKQELVTLSTVEVEYVAVTHAAKESIWLCCLPDDMLALFPTATTLFCDNQAAICLAFANNYHTRTKHIDICYHFICCTIQHGEILLAYCSTDDMTENILTKALLHWKVTHHAAALGLGHPCRGVLESGGLNSAGAPGEEPDQLMLQLHL